MTILFHLEVVLIEFKALVTEAGSMEVAFGAFFPGMVIFWPTLTRFGLEMPLWEARAAAVTPYFFAMAPSVSPLRMTWVAAWPSAWPRPSRCW